jgi:transposase
MNNKSQSIPEPQFAAYIGLDWADEKHSYVLCLPDGSEIGRGQIQHTPEAIEAWVKKIRERFAAQPVAVALELNRGPLVWALCEHPFLALYPVTPQASSEFRKALHPSGAKSDPADSVVLVKILMHHRDRLRRLQLADTQTRLLAELCRARRDAVQERTCCVLKLTAALKEYFPFALQFVGPLKNDAACRVLLKWPSLSELQQAPRHRVRKFLYGLNCRQEVEERLQLIAPATPLTNDSAVIASGRRRVALLAEMILTLNRHIADYEQSIKELFKNHPDRELFDNLPGAGPALAPRLLVSFGLDRARYQSAAELSSYSGIAPIQISSGKSKYHKMRVACPKFLRQSFHEFAGKAVAFCPWSRKYYDAQVAKGKTHNQAIRSLAFKWQRILWACWTNNQPYRQETYLKALKRSGSPYALEVKIAA